MPLTKTLDRHFGLFLSENGKSLTTQLKELGLLEHSTKFIRKYILSYGGTDFTTPNLLKYLQKLTTVEYRNEVIRELAEILRKKQDSSTFKILEILAAQAGYSLNWHSSKFHSFVCELLWSHLTE